MRFRSNKSIETSNVLKVSGLVACPPDHEADARDFSFLTDNVRLLDHNFLLLVLQLLLV